MTKCNLPLELDIKDVGQQSVDKAYEIYKETISNNKSLNFKGIPIKVSKNLDYNLKDQTFEHLVFNDMKVRL